MNNVQKLAQMGCGIEILNSCIERSNLNAAISNSNTFFKYVKQGVKSGLFNKEDSKRYIIEYYKRLLELQPLAELYSDLWGEKYYKIKLSIEKFYSNNI